VDNEAQYFLDTARDSLNSLKNKFDIRNSIEHRLLLILCTDCVELSLKALLYLYGWPRDKIKSKIRHNLKMIFKFINAPEDIINATARFDDNNWSWLRRYPETCYSAQTTEFFSDDPLPYTEQIVDWVTLAFDNFKQSNQF